MTQFAAKRRPEAQFSAAARRFDLYAGVHKGLRSFMAETLVSAGRMDVYDAPELAATLAQVRALLEACSVHLQIEEQFLHPALEARRSGSARATARDHEEHLRALERLEAAVQEVERALPDARTEAAMRLYRALALFVAENLEHMHAEETANNATLWATHTDAELAAIHKAIIASLPPPTAAGFMRWIVPAMSPAERAELFTGMQLGAPRAAFEGMLGIARAQLPASDWTKLAAALGPVPNFG